MEDQVGAAEVKIEKYEKNEEGTQGQAVEPDHMSQISDQSPDLAGDVKEEKEKDQNKKVEAPKQALWLEHVAHMRAKATDPLVKNLLERISNFPNIPRTRPKFHNFIRSCTPKDQCDPNLIDKTFDALDFSDYLRVLQAKHKADRRGENGTSDVPKENDAQKNYSMKRKLNDATGTPPLKKVKQFKKSTPFRKKLNKGPGKMTPHGKSRKKMNSKKGTHRKQFKAKPRK